MTDPQKYHDEAERLRRKALETDNLVESGALIDIAELYDRLYDRLIEAHRRRPKSGYRRFF
jgi:RNA polymerase-interacting CarD/CdnL/TRCF family regulator